MLTVDMIRTWLRVRGNGTVNEHAIAALAKQDVGVAAAWENSMAIDNLIGSAKIVLNGLASRKFEAELHEQIACETDGPLAAEAIWNAAKIEQQKVR